LAPRLDAGTQPPTAYEKDAKPVVLEFPDNFLLIDLCGEHDRNLADVELKLGVQVLRRGNQLAIHGEADAVKEAGEILTSLYERLEAGRAVEPADIDREMRMGASEKGTGSPVGDQMDMGLGERVEIRPAKRWLNRAPLPKKPTLSPCLKMSSPLGLVLRGRVKPTLRWPLA